LALEEDIPVIEDAIRQIHVEWDKFFAGIERKPPNDLKMRLEALIRRHANAETKNNTDRFRYQTLVARYNTLNELWQKKLRAREEGKAFGVHGIKADLLPPPPPPPASVSVAAADRGLSPGGPGEFRLQGVQRDEGTVRALYDRFLAARQEVGESARIKFESFQKLIDQQASRLLGDKGGQAVAFRLETKDGKVCLKAKVVK
jgi:hypothetical protein